MSGKQKFSKKDFEQSAFSSKSSDKTFSQLFTQTDGGVHVFPERKLEMPKEEMGQIGLAFTRHYFAEKGIRIKSGFRREMGELAKELGVEFDRLVIFAEILAREAFEKMLNEGKPSK